VTSSANLSRRLKALEGASPVEALGPAFLWSVGRQTYDEALAFAGLTGSEPGLLAIRLIGVKPEPRSAAE
jgi:hypothetical protein